MQGKARFRDDYSERGKGLVNGADKSLAGAWDGEDLFGYFFMEKKRRERGNREKKERKSKKNGMI